MADNKVGPNLQAGAGFLAKRVQRSLSRAQEKVLQKLGKTMETRDEQFEVCSQNLNKQQMDGSRIFKDVKAYYAAIKAVHETSKRLSQTLREVYESDWNGVEDLAVITESEDLLWNDYEEKMSDQIVRTMENYTSQFPEVKERVAKRGRKLVDYDSARHHLEALQSAKKKDEAKITKAEEEFNKAQSVFEEINTELREELPILYQSRIGCYVTVFQNISNLRDVFYKEMSVLNHELYNVMKKLETQHSGKAFIVKGLHSATTKTKKRKSIVISNPIPCNTAFPADHVSIHSNGPDAAAGPPSSPPPRGSQSASEETSLAEEESGVSSKDVNSSDSDLSSSGANTPRRRSLCATEPSDRSDSPDPDPEPQPGPEPDAEAELAADQSDDSGVGVPKAEAAGRDAAATPSDSAEGDAPLAAESEEPRAAPVPAPRGSFRSAERGPLLPPKEEGEEEEEEEKDPQAEDQGAATEAAGDSDSHNPPGFLYKAVALENHEAAEGGLLQFQEGDVILVLEDADEREGLLRGIREESWSRHGVPPSSGQLQAGTFPQTLVKPLHSH